MQTLKLIQLNNCLINYKLGKEIGCGADGQLFELADFKDKVIKISVIFDLDFIGKDVLNNKYDAFSKNLSYLQQHNTIFAKVFDFQKIGIFKRLFNNIDQYYLLHYCVMEKCFKLTEDEKKVFHTIISHEDRGITKKFSTEKIEEILFGLSRGLDFDSKKIKLFYESVMTSPIKHLDLHPRNIMKDINGNFRLIDFDRIQLEIT